MVNYWTIHLNAYHEPEIIIIRYCHIVGNGNRRPNY